MAEDINVGAISEALNNKVDLNQLNTNKQGLSYGSGWSMPSNRYIDLTLGASGSSYTAPANGWLLLTKRGGTANALVILENSITSLRGTGTNGADIYEVAGANLPVCKGDVINVYYSATGENLKFRFIYAEGEE